MQQGTYDSDLPECLIMFDTRLKYSEQSCLVAGGLGYAVNYAMYDRSLFGCLIWASCDRDLHQID